MAADTIIIKYKADTTKFSQDVKGLTGDLNKVEVAGVKAGDKTAASFNKAATAVNKTDKQTKQTTSAFNGMGALLTNIASSIDITFGVQQVIQFGKASAEAFIDAEKNAQLLLFALKGNEAAQGRLMAQASELQNTTIFDDDSIQQAQTFLANQGRTEEQIKKVINAAVELSTVTGVDLQTAVMQLDGTLEGNIGKMGKLDSAFKGLTKEQLANGAAADLLIEKYGGTAKAMGDTTAGQVAKLKNQFGELQETVGGELIGFVSGLTEAFNGLLELNPEKFFKNIAISQFASFVYDSIAGTDKLTESVTDFEKKAIEIGNATDKEIKEKFEALGGATNATAVEFKKFTDEMRSGILQQTLEGLSSVLDINEKQFKELTDQTDKYGISVRVTSEAILGLKNATEEQLLVTFLNANAALGVTREDFDKYVGTIKGIKPLHDDIAKSTEKIIGPFDQLSNRITLLNKELLDAITLGKDYTKIEMEIGDAIKRSNEIREEAAASIIAMTPIVRENNDAIILNTEHTETNYEAIKKANDLKLKGIIATMGQVDAEAEMIKTLQKAGDVYGELANLAGALNGALTAIFGEAAEKNLAFLAFQKAITIAQISFKAAETVANGIAAFSAGVSTGNVAQIIGGIASIVSGVGTAIGGIIDQVNSIQTPSAPSFFVGTDDTGSGGGLDGRGGFAAVLHPHEAVINAERNSEAPGLAKAWLGGNLEGHIIDKWVSPALVAQEKQINKDFANDIATSMLLQQGGNFNDYRMRLLLGEGNSINKSGFTSLAKALKNGNNPRLRN